MCVLVGVFLWKLYANPAYGLRADGRDTLWLLYVLALHGVGEVRGVRLRHLAGMVLLAGTSLLLARIWGLRPGSFDDGMLLVSSTMPKVEWIAMLSFAYYVAAQLMVRWWRAFSLVVGSYSHTAGMGLADAAVAL